MDAGLLLLRVVAGLTLAAHGSGKLFGWFDGPGLDRTGAGMEALGFSPGRRHARRAGLAEFGGGLLFAAGLATPLAGAFFVSLMAVAAIAAHAPKGFFITRGGFEYNLILGTIGASVAFTGPGAWSADAALGMPGGGVAWGAGAAVLGFLGAGAQLAQRRAPRPQTAAA